MIHYEPTALGRIGIVADESGLVRLCFATDPAPAEEELGTTALTSEAFRQLQAYLAGRLTAFSLPLAPQGSSFMAAVWQALGRIPFGETASYREIAAAVAAPRAARAVGLACNRNPLPLFIPCHRVVGVDGRLTGYRGGLEMKQRLLALERTGRLPDALP